MQSSRIIHVASAVATLALGLASYVFVGELWKDRTTTFATVGVFLTLYGVAFAIIETWRARAASELARDSAKAAREQTASIFDIKNIADCQSCIRYAISDLEKEGWASTASLSRIVELYTAQFHTHYNDPKSIQRELIASLISHAAAAGGPLQGRALNRLRLTLVNMLSNLTVASSEKIVEIAK